MPLTAIIQRFMQRMRHHICPVDPLLVQLPPGGSLLDVGCGTGSLLITAARRGLITEGLGVDPLNRAIRCAQETWQKEQSFLAARLSFETGTTPSDRIQAWDAVTMVDVIHHVPPSLQHDLLLASLNRVKPGGVFIYKDMCLRPFWKAGMNRLHDLVVARDWIHYVPIAQVEQWAREQGFKRIHSSDYSRLWYGHELRVFLRHPVAIN